MNTFECNGCGHQMSEKEEYCKYCGSANPIFSGTKKEIKATDMVRPSDASNTTNSFGIGFLLGSLGYLIGLVISCTVLKNKKTLKGAITGFSIVSAGILAIIPLGIVIGNLIPVEYYYINDSVNTGDITYKVNRVYDTNRIGNLTSTGNYVVLEMTVENTSPYLYLNEYLYYDMMIYHNSSSTYYINQQATKELSNGFYTHTASSTSYITLKKNNQVTFTIAFLSSKTHSTTDYLTVKEDHTSSATSKKIYLGYKSTT